MKNIVHKSLALISLICIFCGNYQVVASSSPCGDENPQLNAKFRILGDWNQDGVPDYLDVDNDEVSKDLIDYLEETIPENLNIIGSEYFSDDVQLNTELLKPSKVYLTYVHEGATYTNTLGFYTYDINNPPATVDDIDSLVIIFPNVTQPDVVQPGNKVFLGEFPAYTGIGYFLIQNGWVGDSVCLGSKKLIFTDSRFNTYEGSTEGQQQSILLNYEAEEKFLLAFEDVTESYGDKDFNDAVFYISTDPGSVDTTDIPKLPAAKISGDTILCNESDLATIKVKLYGYAPWKLVYNNGIEDVTVENIMEDDYIIETDIKNTFKLVSVQDLNGWGVIRGTATVQVLNPTAVMSGESTICAGKGSAEVNIDLTGTGPWDVVYQVGEDQFSVTTDQSLLKLDITSPGDISLISVNDEYCPGSVSGNITHKEVGIDLALESDEKVCFGDDINLELSGELLDAEVKWSSTGSGTFAEGAEANQMIYQPAEGESGIITIGIAASNACGSATIQKEVKIIEDLDATFTVSAKNKLNDTPISFIPQIKDYDSYKWYFGDVSESDETEATYAFEEGGIYSTELIVSKEGCEKSYLLDVEIYTKDKIFIPNAFNPSAINPENRVVKVYGKNVSDDGFSFRIFNRWGHVVYQTFDWKQANSEGWDGIRMLNDEELSTNTFTYLCKGKFQDSNEYFEIAGTVTLIK